MRIRRLLAAVILVGFLPVATTACIGRFALTRKLYSWNRSFNPDKWVQWIAFLALNVIFVYPFSLAFDAIFANSVEFWTGNNPVAWRVGETRVAVGPDGERVSATLTAPGHVRLEAVAPDGTTYLRTLAYEDGLLVARDGQGRVLGRRPLL